MTEKMKPSRIAWIGDIPQDWNIKRVKYLASLKGRIGWQGLTSDEYIEEGPYLITGIDFQNGGIDWNNCVHISEERWAEAPEIHIQNGDLLITKDGTVGKVAIVSGLEGKASLNSGVLLIRTNPDFDKRFLFWVLQSEEFWTWFRLKNAGNSTIIHLYQGDFAEFSYTFPNTAEQRAIADFLDSQCAKIDSVIADIEKQIETLQKYKKSLITEAVTKGLERSVPMKDSGIEWIGKIPKHWNINKTRYLASLCSGATPSKDVYTYWEGNIPWVSSQEVKSDIITDTSLHISEEAIRSCSTKLMPAGTLVMVVRSGILQHTIPVALLGVPATINQDIKAFVFKPEMIPAYYKYYIQGENDALLNVLIKDKTTVESIDNNLLLSLRIMVPPIQEQKDIVNYLDERCSKINSIISDKQEQLDAIIQHKKSLIYEYVTGKKRVTEVN